MRIKMPAVRIAQAESDTGQIHQDILTCGVCQKPFALGDINKFIQHKVHACNKENYAIESNNVQESPDNDGAGCGGVPLAVVNTRRPSISAPIKKGINAPGRLVCSSPLQLDEEARCSTPKPRSPNSSTSPTPIKNEINTDHHENCTDEYDLKPRKIKQELDSTNSSPDLLLKKHRAEVTDAESNTTHSEPNYYICSTCKLRLHSAWRLLQHAQNCHGIKIYLESSSSTNSSPSVAHRSAQAKHTNNHSSSSSCSGSSASSGCSRPSSAAGGGGVATSLAASSLPLPSAAISSRLPLLPPTSLSSSSLSPSPSSSIIDPHNPFGVGGLLRMPPTDPSRHHQFPSPLGGLHNNVGHHNGSAPSVFTRPSSSSHHHDNHFRMEQIVSEQFRLNQHHSLGLAAAAAAVAAASAGIPPPHSPYSPVDRPLSSNVHTGGARSMIPPPPSLPLSLEPQLDFYSQRLRQLAGTTSPGIPNGGSNSLSPRKLTPPFTSAGNSQPLAPNRLSSSSSRSGSTNNNNNNSNNNNNNNNNNFNNHNNNNNNVSKSNNNLHHKVISSERESDREHSVTPPPLKLTNHEDLSVNDSLDLSANVKSTNHRVSVDEKPADFSLVGQHCGAGVNAEFAANKTQECEHCGRKFRFKSNLIVHKRTHTGDKPYKCTVCSHACTQSSKLKRHMKIHRNSNQGNGKAGGEAEVMSTNRDGSTTSAPDQISYDGSENERVIDDDEEVAEEEDEDEDEEDEEEEEEEEEEDEDEEEDEEEDMGVDEEGDEDDDGDVPEDLTTKSNASTPPNANEENSKSIQSPRPTPSQTPLDKTPSDKNSSSGSLVGELMDKFGLSTIKQYSEAYKQALQESIHNPPRIGKKDADSLLESSMLVDNNNGVGKLAHPIVENGRKMKSCAAAAALKLKDEFAKNMIGVQPPLDIIGASHGFFSAGLPFENLLDAANKRIKLDIDGHHNPLLGRNNISHDTDMYPGLWLPAMAAAHHRDLFARNEVPMDIFKPRSKSNSENRHAGSKSHHNSSLAAAAAAAAAMNLPVSIPTQHLKKESRRNDTCEYCGKIFKNCSNLTVHRRSHTGEKPYKCELCTYACAQSSKLTRHMKTHGRMGKDVYRCRFCEMPFSVPSTLEKHMRKCVVSQNMKGDNGHLMSSMLIKCEDDSSISSTKDNT